MMPGVARPSLSSSVSYHVSPLYSILLLKHKELANVDLGLGLESWLGLGIGSGVVEGLWGTPFPQIFLEEMPFPK